MVKFYCKEPDVYQVSKGDLKVDFIEQIAETEDERTIEFLRSLQITEEITKEVSEESTEEIIVIENTKGKENGSKQRSKSIKS